MRCEFCESDIHGEEPENVTLLVHVAASEECQRGYEYLLENLRSSWTPAMSGG